MRPKVHEEALRQRAPISLQLTLCNLPDAALAMQLYDYIAKRAAMGPPRPPAAAAAAAAAANAPSRHPRSRPAPPSRAFFDRRPCPLIRLIALSNAAGAEICCT